MGEFTRDSAQSVSRSRAFGRGPGRIEGVGPAASFRASVAASSHSSTAGRWLDHGGRGERRGYIPAGSTAGRVAVPEGRACGSAGRGREAEAGEAARCQAAGSDRGDGLRAAAAGTVAMDADAGRRGGSPKTDRRQDRPRDDSQNADPPRAEAVAGKKCGAFRSWTRST